jgi:hypothetical protein
LLPLVSQWGKYAILPANLDSLHNNNGNWEPSRANACTIRTGRRNSALSRTVIRRFLPDEKSMMPERFSRRGAQWEKHSKEAPRH